ncbi:MAG: SPOR domain-containing protein [Pseudomonadota bacterium]
MADPQLVTQEEMALRRRARRRLVGAVAIALVAVVFLPMLFDPEPKPLGEDVDLRIPAKDSPFETPQAAPAVPEPPPQSAEPTLPVPAPLPTGEVDPLQGKVQAVPAAEVKTPEAKPVEAKPEARPVNQSESKPATAKPAEPKAEAKPKAEPKAAAKAEPKPEPKPVAKPEPVQGTKGFVLQLGAFGSETNAKLLLDKVQAAGFKAMIQSGGGQYRVRVGPMADHDKAVDMQNKLKAKGFSPVLMGP